MFTDELVLLILDLAGTFAFAVNGAMTAIRVAKLDIVGVVTLGMITALGGGIMRDILLGDLPPVTFSDWRYLVAAAAGGLLASVIGRRGVQLLPAIIVLDAAGLGLFAVTGATRALDFGAGAGQAVLLGALTAVGGGTLRDVLIQRVPSVLHSGLYAVPALVGATATIVLGRLGVGALLTGLVAAGLCFGIRMLGVRLKLNAPRPRRIEPP